MSTSWNPDVDVCLTDSDDEDNDENKRDWSLGRDAMIFVLDAYLYEDKERFNEALEIVRSAFVTGLLVNDKDLMGVVLANTEYSPDPYEPGCLENIVVPQNCAVFLPLRQLTKHIVEHLLNFLSTATEKFGNQYGVANNSASYASIIRLCINLFDHSGYACNSSKIVYLTDREAPHAPQSNEFQMALQKASDLEGRAIEYHVIPMVDEFNYDLFYKEFLCLVKAIDIDSFQAADPQQLREILCDRKLKQDYLRRTLGHFNFSLGPNLSMSVQYYNYFKNRSYPRKVKLLRKTNEIVNRKMVIMARKQDPDTLEFVEEREIKTTGGWHEINLGQMPIRITPEQILRVKNLHAPGMMLLGFKPMSALDSFMYYKPSNFMYPDDKTIIGSKRLFRALWQRCLEREKIAVCIFMRKKRSIPRYVALVPVSSANKTENDFHNLLSGDGFKIVYLPMAKHVRTLNLSSWNSLDNEASSEGVEFFEKVIKKLRIKYQPSLINDPVLERLRANLLALALNIKTDNGGLTEMPNAEKQDERIANLLPKLEQIFGKEVEATKKRAAKAPAEANAPKIAKITEDDIQNSEYVAQLVKNQTLSSCTVAQLRSILKSHYDVTLAKSATKPVLIAKINELS